MQIRAQTNFIFLTCWAGTASRHRLTFALANFAAFKIDPSTFQFPYGDHSFFSFVYYSAGNMFHSATGMIPVTMVSQVIQLIQFVFSVLLLVIFIGLVITMQNEKYAAELSEVIQSLEKEGRTMEGVIRAEFDLGDIRMAIQVLESAKASLLGFILYMTRDLEE